MLVVVAVAVAVSMVGLLFLSIVDMLLVLFCCGVDVHVLGVFELTVG